ncbi:MAG: sugar ABC transporter permease [Armatimonadetes bacterium]|nr:sugar ABC transporter permease [Armatimonadota bacterium]
MSLFYSFFKWNGFFSSSMIPAGLSNWVSLFKDTIFWKAAENNFLLVVISILIQIPIGLLLGVLVSTKLKGMKLIKLLYFLPMMLSAVGIGLLWEYIYDPNFGLINAVLNFIGLGNLTHGWLGDPKTAIWSVFVVICWEYIPFYMIIFAAALSGIPKELFEAARIDGATHSQTFFKVTLPLLTNAIRTSTILALIGSLQYFALIYVMTDGGPTHSTEVMALLMYKQAFRFFKTGYGSTIAVFMFVLSLSLTLVTLKLYRRGREYEV